jgi:hypothetical protein
MSMVDPHSGPSGHLSSGRRGRETATAMCASSADLSATQSASSLTHLLSPVDRGRGAERSETEWGSATVSDAHPLPAPFECYAFPFKKGSHP